jgi:hypothetical protein
MSSLHELDDKISSSHQPIDSNRSAMAIGVCTLSTFIVYGWKVILHPLAKQIMDVKKDTHSVVYSLLVFSYLLNSFLHISGLMNLIITYALERACPIISFFNWIFSEA